MGRIPSSLNWGNNYSCGAGAIASQQITGLAETEFDGQRFGGPLYRNSPVSGLSNFGSATAPNGGDAQEITLSSDNLLRGASFSTIAKDTIILAAWMPKLGTSGVYLPRCVRYSEGIPTTPATPSRRRQYGPDGILLAVAYSQDALTQVVLGAPSVLNATGIAGCLGSGYGVPIARIDVDPTGALTLAKSMGGVEGIRTYNGFPRVLNRIVASQQLSHTGGIDSTVISSSTPSLITNTPTLIPVQAGDELDITWGPLSCLANSALNGSVQLVITEDSGVSNTPVVTKSISLPDTYFKFLTFTQKYLVTKTGNLQVSINVVSADNTHTIQVTSLTISLGTYLNEWGSYTLIRPL